MSRTPICELHDDGEMLRGEEHLQQLHNMRVARAHALIEQLQGRWHIAVTYSMEQCRSADDNWMHRDCSCATLVPALAARLAPLLK